MFLVARIDSVLFFGFTPIFLVFVALYFPRAGQIKYEAVLSPPAAFHFLPEQTPFPLLVCTVPWASRKQVTRPVLYD